MSALVPTQSRNDDAETKPEVHDATRSLSRSAMVMYGYGYGHNNNVAWIVMLQLFFLIDLTLPSLSVCLS